MTDNKTIQDLRGTLKHTPQPSPQSEMVAVPREVVDYVYGVLRYLNTQAQLPHPGFGKVAKMNSDDALSMLQPYTKGQ